MSRARCGLASIARFTMAGLPQQAGGGWPGPGSLAVGSGWFMDSRVQMIAAVAAVGAALLASGSAAASAGVVAVLRSQVWGTAQEVPGTAALNRGGDAFIASVSCAAADNCGAGGGY